MKAKSLQEAEAFFLENPDGATVMCENSKGEVVEVSSQFEAMEFFTESVAEEL